ncbi:MAG: hypothetical protein HRU07_09980 [Nitrosopumilus sp.]|nr:hypothetical protein [Nitrosopumilus sp.]NRA06456.1 hypothetical protein [Nitrosopumilus sp.]
MRRALSPLIGSMILLGIAVTLAGTYAIVSNDMSQDKINCEITSLEIFEISDNNYWGTITILNNGNYDIQEYVLVLYGGDLIILELSTDSILIEDSAIVEFEIPGFVTNEMVIGVDISNESRKSHCSNGIIV